MTIHEAPDDVLIEHFLCKWKHRSAPARGKKRRTKPPAWALTLRRDRDANVQFERPIACPSCGVLGTGLDGGRGEIDDGGLVDVIQCPVCRAMVVLDLRVGTLRAPTEAERRRWRVTFWFDVMRDAQGD